MRRIFEDNGVKPEELLLPFEDVRLFSDIKELKINESYKERVIKKAEENLKKDIPALPATLFLDFTRTGNRANYENAYFTRLDMANYFIFAEWLEGEGRFIDKIIDITWAIMEQSSWMIPASHPNNSPVGASSPLPPVYDHETLHGIELVAPSAANILAFAKYFHREKLDAIAPVICQKIDFTVKDRIIKPYLNHHFHWQGGTPRKVNNWGPWITSNVLLLSCLVKLDDETRRKIAKQAAFTIDEFTKNYHEDGGCDEGPSYWGAAGASLFDCLEILVDMTGGRVNLYSDPLVKAIGEYIYKVNISGKSYANFADCGHAIKHDCSLLMRYGKKCNSDPLYSFGEMCNYTYDDSFIFPFRHNYRCFKKLYSEDVKKKPDLPAARRGWLSGLKIMTARSTDKWDEGSYVAVKGGHNDESHNHNDVGTFIFYRDGKPVVIDAGVGKYTRKTFSAERYTLWFMQSEYHNLPTFNGKGQLHGARYASSNEVYDEESGAVSMELKTAYPEELGISSFVRKVHLDGEVLNLTDTVKLNEEGEYDLHLLLHRKPEFTDKGVLLTENVLLVPDEKLEVSSEPFVLEGMDPQTSWGTDSFYRLHLKNVCKENSFTIKLIPQ